MRLIEQTDRASGTLLLCFLRICTEEKDSSTSITRGETEANIGVADEGWEKAAECGTKGSMYYLGWRDVEQDFGKAT